MLVIGSNQNTQKCRIAYESENGGTMYIKSISKTGTIYGISKMKKGKKFPFLKAVSIQMELEAEGMKVKKIYE